VKFNKFILEKLVEFTLGKKIPKQFPIFLLKNGEILPKKKTQVLSAEAFFFVFRDSLH
jgi:hypothetical protein